MLSHDSSFKEEAKSGYHPIALILCASTAALAWTDGTEKTTTDSPKTDVGTTAPAEGGAKESRAPSAVTTELSHLREELDAQHAALDAQQARIPELEAQLHSSTVGQAIPASGLIVATTAASVVSQPAAGIASPTPPQSGGSAENQQKSSLSFKLGQVDFTPGGWVDLTGIFRSTDIGSETGTSFASIPFNNTLLQASFFGVSDHSPNIAPFDESGHACR